MKGITKTIENETNKQQGGFLGTLLGTLGASSLRNMLSGERIVRAGYGNIEGKGILKAGNGSKNF